MPTDISSLGDIWVFGAIGFIACFLWGLQGLKNGYKEGSLTHALGSIFFRSCGAIVLSVGTILLLPQEIQGVQITQDIKIGIAIAMGVFGQGLLDYYLKKKFGLTTLDLMDKSDMDHVRSKMDEADRDKHAEQCPFKEDMPELKPSLKRKPREKKAQDKAQEKPEKKPVEQDDSE